jgi:hypothetical protein
MQKQKLTKEEVQLIVDYYKDLHKKLPEFPKGELMIRHWELIRDKGKSDIIERSE